MSEKDSRHLSDRLAEIEDPGNTKGTTAADTDLNTPLKRKNEQNP